MNRCDDRFDRDERKIRRAIEDIKGISEIFVGA